jgi:hypothetical protein
MALSKAATLLERSRRKLRISVVMLMMPPIEECFVPFGAERPMELSYYAGGTTL